MVRHWYIILGSAVICKKKCWTAFEIKRCALKELPKIRLWNLKYYINTVQSKDTYARQVLGHVVYACMHTKSVRIPPNHIIYTVNMVNGGNHRVQLTYILKGVNITHRCLRRRRFFLSIFSIIKQTQCQNERLACLLGK